MTYFPSLPSVVLLSMLLGGVLTLEAQAGSPLADAPVVSASGISAAKESPQFPLSGSIPTEAASNTELQLSLHDAIERGLKNNLAILLSSDATSDAQAERWRA